VLRRRRATGRLAAGRFERTDEIDRWLPEFEDIRVFVKGPVNTRSRALYRRVGFDMGTVTDGDLTDACRTCAALPPLFQPGTAWGYSVATLPTSSAG
jgi:hypothetical protein